MTTPIARPRSVRERDPEVDDAAVMARVHAGDVSALGLLYDRYDSDVRRLITRLGVNASDVDDLVQQTFLEVLHGAKNYDGRASARPWILGVATFIVRRHRRSLSTWFKRVTAWGHEPQASPLQPDVLSEASESARRTQRALDRISDKKREVFLLVTLEGLPGETVAKLLDIPVATVWTRLHHARRELRDLLAEEEP